MYLWFIDNHLLGYNRLKAKKHLNVLNDKKSGVE